MAKHPEILWPKNREPHSRRPARLVRGRASRRSVPRHENYIAAPANQAHRAISPLGTRPCCASSRQTTDADGRPAPLKAVEFSRPASTESLPAVPQALPGKNCETHEPFCCLSSFFAGRKQSASVSQEKLCFADNGDCQRRAVRHGLNSQDTSSCFRSSWPGSRSRQFKRDQQTIPFLIFTRAQKTQAVRGHVNGHRFFKPRNVLGTHTNRKRQRTSRTVAPLAFFPGGMPVVLRTG